MPYSKDPSDYPVEFFELFNQVITTEQPVNLTLASPGEATNLRHRLYSFRRALQRTKTPGYEKYMAVSIQVSGVHVRVFVSDSLATIRKQLGTESPRQIDEKDFDNYLKQLEAHDGQAQKDTDESS